MQAASQNPQHARSAVVNIHGWLVECRVMPSRRDVPVVRNSDSVHLEVFWVF